MPRAVVLVGRRDMRKRRVLQIVAVCMVKVQ